jgi:anti-sigma factor RsiW
MACLPEETILALCEGDLNAIEASQSRDHLLVCPACRLTADRYRELNLSLARPVLNEPPPLTVPQVLQRLYPALPRYTSIIAAIAASLVFLITWIYIYFDFSGSSLIQALRLTADGTSGWLANTVKAISAVYNAAQAVFRAGNALLNLLLPAPLATVVIAGSLLAFAALLAFLFTVPRRKKMQATKS